MLTLEHTQVREAAAGLLARGVAAMVVKLRQASGSVPREAGTRILDQRIGEAILKRGDFAYFGLIGSRSKRERFARRWAERGIEPSLVARVACPIGLPGIEGKEPGIIAVSVVAQMLDVPGSHSQPSRSSSPAGTGW